MNREAALARATEVVEAMGNKPETNNRGYKVDGWKTPTLTERTDAILRLAEFLLDTPDQVEPPAIGPAYPTVFGWRLNSGQPPTAAQYHIAKAWRDSIPPGRAVEAAMADGARRLIEAYEDTLPQDGPPA